MSKPRGESRGLSYLKEVRPEAVRHLLSFFRESATHLDPKTRFLISVVTKVISNSPRGVEQYVGRALEAGASPDEIIDAVLCAYPCAGLTRVVDAIDVILDLDRPEFTSSREEVTVEAESTSVPAVGSPDGSELSQVVLEDDAGGWHDVGSLSELEGDRRIRVLAGRHDVAIFLVDGEVRAIGNRCPHAGAPLSEGFVHGGVVVCPLHAWRFELATGRCPEIPRASVPTYETRVRGDRVEVRFP